jgi:hypothetical protein
MFEEGALAAEILAFIKSQWAVGGLIERWPKTWGRQF